MQGGETVIECHMVTGLHIGHNVYSVYIYFGDLWRLNPTHTKYLIRRQVRDV